MLSPRSERPDSGQPSIRSIGFGIEIDAGATPRHARRPAILARTHRLFVYAFAALFAGLLGACATRPPASAFHRDASFAISQGEPTHIGDALDARALSHPGLSGFRLLRSGSTALEARLALANAAQRTLDMQYYIADEDDTGKLVLEAALRAADRGVRVRMLVDDLNFKDLDNVMLTLNHHPHIEIRVFNPFATAGEGVFAKVGNAMTQMNTLTRRMHNKALVVDNRIAVVGGRNIGDEYFDASPDRVFRDLDVIVAGPLVANVSASFDEFWNSDEAYPLRALNTTPIDEADIARVRQDLGAHWQHEFADIGQKPLYQSALADQLARETVGLVWARGEFLADHPRKVDGDPDYESPPAHRLGELVRAAQHSIDILSPYFVPHDRGVATLSALSEHGVQVRVLTNSLASTDAVAVHAGYSPYRLPLLSAGVELFEFKPVETPVHVGGLMGSRSRASLHAKAYVIDRRIAVIGSMNLDRRSVGLNTELTVVIHSAEIAAQVEAMFEHAIAPQSSYQVELASQAENALMKSLGHAPTSLVWVTEDDGMRRTYDYDPDAGLWRNVETGLFFVLPVKNQL
ncbi:phospholipase D family protein [Pararobbsia silviterrae]|uniref:Phospholipase D family protein n=2 Tax=Pararobbsia silviterrae TaxID=1792498 RepID=A0A494YA05_9BURK|nr:phospholipase D family protein [Pararobbsia silviterrae]